MGLNSPGVCVWDPTQSTLTFHIWPQRKREYNLQYEGKWSSQQWKEHADRILQRLTKPKTKTRSYYDPFTSTFVPASLPTTATSSNDNDNDIHVRIHAFPPLPKVEENGAPLIRFKRYKRVTSDIVSICQGCCAKDRPPPIIGIENYSFAEEYGSMIAYENGGILRYHLTEAGFAYHEFPPLTVKKMFKGEAADKRKLTMYKHFVSLNIIPTFAQALRFKEGYTPSEDVPKPLQDIVDSFALVHLLRYKERFVPLIKKKKKKTTTTTKRVTPTA